MYKTAIVYASFHHGNTRKLVEAISAKYDVTIIDAKDNQRVDLTEYDLIGFASGIAFGSFYDCVITFLQENLPENKKVFFLCTCAKNNKRFTERIRKESQKMNASVLGVYGCKGYNTYGPWKLVGGMNRHHPNTEELAGAVSFYESLLK